MCTFNDDDHRHAAATALAGIPGALRLPGQKLWIQRFLRCVCRAGSAATGIADSFESRR